MNALEMCVRDLSYISQRCQKLEDELQELKSKRDKLAYDLGVADTKNGELLRLLKECKRLLKEYNYTFPTNDFEKSDKLLTKIGEVLK